MGEGVCGGEGGGTRTVVVDADDLLADPPAVMRAYCDAVGLPFSPSMLSWNPGPVDAWLPGGSGSNSSGTNSSGSSGSGGEDGGSCSGRSGSSGSSGSHGSSGGSSTCGGHFSGSEDGGGGGGGGGVQVFDSVFRSRGFERGTSDSDESTVEANMASLPPDVRRVAERHWHLYDELKAASVQW